MNELTFVKDFTDVEKVKEIQYNKLGNTGEYKYFRVNSRMYIATEGSVISLIIIIFTHFNDKNNILLT